MPAILLGWFFGVLAVSFCGVPCAVAGDLKFQAYLVWGTDDSKPPEGKTYKPVETEIGERLSRLLKWKNYFEVRRMSFSVAPGATTKADVSPKCEVDVKDLGKGTVEVVFFGKRKEVARQKQALPKGEMLVLGGNAPNATAWLVALKRTE
jgi:hypothetical protein